ncbi:hypothetical protein [Variovorax sp. J31P207]|uniref:hypothetical protein n=1 Tax=Variovorax sp. J31P207 TaxID=3053510 RepID=UPI0025777889|nr:hypothetical protein [Variovorax sp. J31P207]MDM0071762.1 hypothetical protein [Variovorax sp. J31P207]
MSVSSRLFLLDLADRLVFSVRPDGSDKKIIATGGRLPDGVAVEVEAGHVYWTNIGSLDHNDGSIERVDFLEGVFEGLLPAFETLGDPRITQDLKSKIADAAGGRLPLDRATLRTERTINSSLSSGCVPNGPAASRDRRRRPRHRECVHENHSACASSFSPRPWPASEFYHSLSASPSSCR